MEINKTHKTTSSKTTRTSKIKPGDFGLRHSLAVDKQDHEITGGGCVVQLLGGEDRLPRWPGWIEMWLRSKHEAMGQK